MTIADGGGVTFPVSIDITGSTGIILENDETITNSTNGEVAVNGTVVIGTGSAAGTLKSSGNHDITIQTGNSTTGSITITDGANGDISVTPNGTGQVAMNSAMTATDSNDRPLVISSTDAANDYNLAVGSGPGILFKIPVTTSIGIGAAIDAVKTVDSDGDKSTGLSFKVSQNDETLDEALRIEHDGGIFMFDLGSAGSGTALVIDGSDEIIPSSSSIAYKDNVRTIDSDSSKVFELTPRSFEWKRDGSSDFGLIAEEVHEVMPEMVIYNKHGNPEAVKYDRLSVLLLMELNKIKKELETA